MSFRRTVAIGFLLMALTPAAARADGLLIPFAGVNFGGNAGETFSNGIDAKRLYWGASFAWMGGGVFGFEGDIVYSPDFYGKNDVGGSSVLSLTGNVLLGVTFGGQQGFGVRPFGLVGIGVLKSDLDSFTEQVGFDYTEAARNFGGGVLIFFTSHTGLRGDIRYFRTFNSVDFGPIHTNDSEAVDYTRASVGFVVRY